MILEMATELSAGYTSGSQVARRITEHWGAENLYCPACNNNSVAPTPANTKAIDFVCPHCSVGYQLKAGRQMNPRRVPDGAYDTMMSALNSDRVPNLLILNYTADWSVHDLTLIPSFALNSSAIQKRKPLSPNARRAGWVGCDILLTAISETAKLRVVDRGMIAQPDVIRARYRALSPLAALAPAVRGWTLDLLRLVQSLPHARFTLSDVYEFEDRLATLHPGNRNIRPKIRQQLQVLRDLGLITFKGRGAYVRSTV
jgi:type II restriction enzyme